MICVRIGVVFSVLTWWSCNQLLAQTWNQWRGPNRAGVAVDSPALIDQLPDEGLQPVWVSEDELLTGGSGGWSSPVVSEGRIYVFVHAKQRREEVKLPEPKYPKLDEEAAAAKTDEEFKAYEKLRKAEQTKIRELQYRYSERLFCFDTETGKQLWVNDRDSRSTRFPQSGTPAVVEGVVYQLGARGRVWAVDAQTGENRWATQLPGEWDEQHHAASPIVAGKVLVVSTNHWYGLDTKSGKLLWKSEEEIRNDHASPTVWERDGKAFILANSGKETVCLDSTDGTERWRVESQGGRSTPLVVDDFLITYGNSRKGGVRCFEMSFGGAEHLWTCTDVADEGCSPVVVGNYVYAQGDRRFVCIDLKTGDRQWQTMLDMARPRYTSLIAADDKVIFAAEGVFIAAADAKRFDKLASGKINQEGLLAEEDFHRKALKMDELESTAEGQKKAESLWRKEIDNAGPAQCVTPAIVDGKLILRLRSNRLACYDLRVQR